MDNTVLEKNGILKCSCGAGCTEKKYRNRFLKRHPSLCSGVKKIVEQKKEFTKQLVDGVKSVETEETEDVQLYRIERVNVEGRNLTPWELKFMESVTTSVERNGSKVLTDNQKVSLEKIYVDRVK